MTEAWDLFRTPGERSTVRVEVGKRSCWLYGNGLAKLLDDLQIPRQRDWRPERKGTLMCSVDRVGDLLAWLEWKDRRITEVVAVDR